MKDEVLIELSKKLSQGKESIVERVKFALEQPQKYCKEYKEELEERDISEPLEELAWIALVDALLEEDLAYEIDWEEDIEEACDAIDSLLERKGAKELDWDWVEDEDMEMAVFLNEVSNKLKQNSIILCQLDIDSDSYVLVVVPKAEFGEIKQLDDKLGYTISEKFL